MEIKIESLVIEKALNQIVKTANPINGNVNIKSDGSKLQFFTQSDLNRCITFVPAEVSGEAEFAVPVQALKDAIKGRPVVTLQFIKQMLKIKSANYQIDLATSDAIPVDKMEVGEHQEWVLKPETQKWLKKALQEIKLNPVTQLNPYVPLGISLTAKGIFCTCFDQNRMTWATSKETTGDMEVVLPLDTAQAMLDVFEGQPFKIRLGKGMIEFKSKLTEVGLAIPDLSQLGISLADVMGKAKTIKSEKVTKISVNKVEVLAFLENAKAVQTKERGEIIVADSTWSLKTVQGSAKAKINGTDKVEFKVDYDFVQEAVAKSGDIVAISVGNGFISVELKNSTCLVAQNQ